MAIHTVVPRSRELGAPQAPGDTPTTCLQQEGAPMEGTRPFKVGLDATLRLIAKRLRDDGESVTHEELPQRWVDLILYLEEKERRAKRLGLGAPRKDRERH